MKIMKTFRLFAWAVLAFACIACNKDKGPSAKLIIGGDSFFSNGTASINLMLSDAVSSDVTAYLVCVNEAEEGYSAVPLESLTFDNQVVIKAGETSAKTTLTLDTKDLNSAVKYQAAIKVDSASGAEVSETLHTVFIAVPSTEFGEPDPGPGPGPGPDDPTVPDPVLQANWSVSMVGVGTDEYGDYIQVSVTAPGSSYYGVVEYSDEEFAQYYAEDGISGLISDMQDYVKKNLDEGEKLADILWTPSDGDVYLDYYAAGVSNFFIVDFDASGKVTGKYGKTVLTIPELEEQQVEGAITGPVTLQTNWKVDKLGEIWEDLFGDYHIDIEVTAPGATYFWVDCYTEEEMQKYYPEKGVEDLLLDFSSSVKTSVAEGYDIAEDLLWAPGEKDMYADYYGAGETDFYIMDFDNTGSATGKYGVTRLVVPEMTASAPAARNTRARLTVHVHKASAKAAHAVRKGFKKIR
jgi:hypothetical protein